MTNQTSTLVEYRVDLQKAVGAPNAAYMVRLMSSVNDLLLIRHLSSLSGEAAGGTPKHIRNSSIEYMLRMQQSHLFEACDAFITKMPTSSTSRERKQSVANLIKNKTKLSRSLKALKKLLASPHYARLEVVRNNLAFHYNWFAEGQLTHDAFLQLVENGQKVGVIYSSEGRKHFLFDFADEVRNVAWQNSLCVSSLEDLREFRAFLLKLGAAFLSFSDELILCWIDEFGLAIKS